VNNRLISVQREALTSGLERIESAIEMIDAALDQLEAQARVLRSSWDGEARQAFDVANAQWDASVRRLTAIAKAMSAVAHSSNTRVHEQDRRDATPWRV